MNRRLRILLIDPTDPWVTNSSVLKHHDQVMLPIGPMYLSAYLKKYLADEVEVKVISTLIDLPDRAHLGALLRDYAPDVVGIRCVIFYAEQVKEIAAAVRAALPDALVVAGGPNVTFDNENIQANPDFDILVEGEGEEILYEIADAYVRGGKDALLGRLPEIKGIMFRRDGQLCKTAQRPGIDDLDGLPMPDYDAVDLDRYTSYINYGYNRRRMGILFTSRGCPFHCTYCHMVFGKGFRARSAENVHREIVHLYENYGIKDFSIVDDNFTVHRPRVLEFTRLMIEKGPRVNFYFPNGIRADSLDFALLEKLKEAGTIYITFSLETASPRLQQFIKKYANIEKLRKIVRHSCELNIITNLCIMVGFPTETLEEAQFTLDYYTQFDKLVLPYYFSVKYYPGTEVYRTAAQFGIDLNEESYKTPYHGYEFQETPWISRKDFEKLNQWYLRKIYLNPERIRNAVDILKHHFSEGEIADMFCLFFRRKVTDVEADILRPLEAASAAGGGALLRPSAHQPQAHDV